MSNSKLIQEMYQILNPESEHIVQTIDPNIPREVTGVFVSRGVTMLDEAILESIATMTWEQIANVAMLATIGPSDFSSLISSYTEGLSSFRRTWNAMIEEGIVANGTDRGAFVLLSKACPQTESQAKYVAWCLKVLGDANEAVHLSLIEKSPAVKIVIPTGQTKAQHDKDVDNANKYLGKEFIEPYEGQAQAQTRNRGMENVKKAEAALTKAAAKMGKAPDEAFSNAYQDLARERARNS